MATGQDPYSIKYFYKRVIPKLIKEGKIIIAVTHDEVSRTAFNGFYDNDL